jgi:hypothetical protein
VDGVAWGYALRRGEQRRSVVVIVSRHALRVDDSEALANETRQAIATQGRSEAERIADMADPPRCVLLGRTGYRMAPPTLQRFGKA